jgi:hypothetical protein
MTGAELERARTARNLIAAGLLPALEVAADQIIAQTATLAMMNELQPTQAQAAWLRIGELRQFALDMERRARSLEPTRILTNGGSP